MKTLPTTTGRRRPAAPAAFDRNWSRYERLAFAMLGYTWGLLIVAVSALFFFNQDLDTRTSSTSGSHSAFYNPVKTLAKEPRDDHAP